MFSKTDAQAVTPPSNPAPAISARPLSLLFAAPFMPSTPSVFSVICPETAAIFNNHPGKSKPFD
jgi:hypothetical protein